MAREGMLRPDRPRRHPVTRHLPGRATTACGLADHIRSGRRDPVDAVQAALARVGEVDDDVGAFVLVDADGALEQARHRAAQARRGDWCGRLHGVPVAVKDLFDVRGQLTRAGSQVPADPPAARDAVAVGRLRAAGAVVIGRTRTHEFAWGMTTQHSRLGGSRDPWDTSRVPGGSSGGSAAAVAAGVVPLALGTDTGCSIRLPAAWCGLVGHKPTAGLVPLDGALPLAPSLDHGGALVPDVADARLALEILSGRQLAAPQPVHGLRLGCVALSVGGSGVARVLDAAMDRAAAATGRSRRVSQPLQDELPRLYSTVQGVEALTWHRSTGRWPAHAARYGDDVRAHLERCEQITADQAAHAAALRDRLRRAVDELFRTVDLLLLPVAATGPPSLTDPATVRTDNGPEPLRDAVLTWSVLANLCGLPACSVPVGLDDDGLPVGLQVVGPLGADARVLDLAAAVQVPLR